MKDARWAWPPAERWGASLGHQSAGNWASNLVARRADRWAGHLAGRRDDWRVVLWAVSLVEKKADVKVGSKVASSVGLLAEQYNLPRTRCKPFLH